MNTYALTITSVDPAALVRVLAAAEAVPDFGTSEAVPSTVSGAVEPPPGDVSAAKKAAAAAKRKTVAIAKKKATEAAQQVAEAQKAVYDAAEDLGLDDAPSIDDVKTAVRDYVAANSVDAAKTIFASLNAAKISDIPPDRYAEVIAKLQV